MITARATDIIPIVLYWRFRKASAPSLMAAAISLMPSVPVSDRRTSLASQAAYASESKDSPKTMIITTDSIRNVLFVQSREHRGNRIDTQPENYPEGNPSLPGALG